MSHETSQQDQEGATTFDRLREIASRYEAAFPLKTDDVYLAHLAIASCGAALTQAVERYRTDRFGVNPGRYSVLREVYFAEGHSLYQKEIAHRVNVSSANITQIIDALERSDFVRRIKDLKDKRMTRVILKQDGISLCEAMIPGRGRADESDVLSLFTGGD